MSKIILKIFPNRFWDVAEIYKDDTKIAIINKFYEINDQWILVYDTNGCIATGFYKGNLLSKYFIGDCEFETLVKQD